MVEANKESGKNRPQDEVNISESEMESSTMESSTMESSSKESFSRDMETNLREKLPQFTVNDMLEAGVHYGHRKSRRNPKMQKFIYGVRNGISIIDLNQTYTNMFRAMLALYKVSSKNGRILFVCTKQQGSEIVKDAAIRCGQYYINHRWLGGMLSNWQTVSQSIQSLNELEDFLSSDLSIYKKKEVLNLQRKRDKMSAVLEGVRKMGGVPDLIFILSVKDEPIAIKEAKVLGIPVIGVVDTNTDPDGVIFPIPGNDDSIRALQLYADLAADSVIAGLKNVSSSSYDDRNVGRRQSNNNRGGYQQRNSAGAKPNEVDAEKSAQPKDDSE